jgi:hypothetical protein
MSMGLCRLLSGISRRTGWSCRGVEAQRLSGDLLEQTFDVRPVA